MSTPPDGAKPVKWSSLIWRIKTVKKVSEIDAREIFEEARRVVTKNLAENSLIDFDLAFADCKVVESNNFEASTKIKYHPYSKEMLFSQDNILSEFYYTLQGPCNVK